MQKRKKVAVIMGSDSDFPLMKNCIQVLKDFGVSYEVNVMSAHRTPEEASNFAKNAAKNGFSIIIAAAGKAAHLGGVLAAHTHLPVIGVPIKSSALDGLDALLSTVQMPKGIPVACVAIDGAENAALLAVQMLAIADTTLKEKFLAFKADMANQVKEKNKMIQEEVKKLEKSN